MSISPPMYLLCLPSLPIVSLISNFVFLVYSLRITSNMYSQHNVPVSLHGLIYDRFAISDLIFFHFVGEFMYLVYNKVIILCFFIWTFKLIFPPLCFISFFANFSIFIYGWGYVSTNKWYMYVVPREDEKECGVCLNWGYRCLWGVWPEFGSWPPVPWKASKWF